MTERKTAASDNSGMAQGGGRDSDATTRQEGANPAGQATAGAASHRGRFEALDTNHDGFISRDEGKDAPELNTRFTELDQNNDGKLSPDEYNALNASARGATGSGAMGGKAGGTSSTTK